jgi:uncharacterized repeat protein (TIGR03843 family)
MTEDTEHSSHNDDSSNEPDDRNRQLVGIERAEALLANGQIVALRGATLWGSNYAALVTVSDDELQATAVYKPQRGERPLWDFPDGTLCYRETLSYMVAKALGWYLVPPTLLRHGPHGLGSLQLFIEHNPEINYFSLDDRFDAPLRRFAVFDYLINNTDRKGGHLLLDATGKLWGIDHGLTFHTTPKLRTVIWEFAGERIADDLLEDVRKLSEQIESGESELRCKLNELLSAAEIAALMRRVGSLLERKCYPSPGPGPNHPWPPV